MLQIRARSAAKSLAPSSARGAPAGATRYTASKGAPAVVPGIFSGLVMAFTLSLDDFVISHFVSSPDFQTLPLYIYNQTAHEVKYSMYALCTLIIVTILALLLVVNFAGSIGDRRSRKKEGVK